ncbi:hypothetical protein PFMALIP_01731 [Plasmodium falciparum MaliPS096_E11]|uniref:Erythrocyte membrane protein 1 n=1 Tax=Plasmodium falciparum MaliPS096_E11 TaxID=1036727 RepID=A0A024WSW6_PLAFA|nr:hypothetical protein PFMALIP_01731 [Plasmodium falciparum MaliPS096_E11]
MVRPKRVRAATEPDYSSATNVKELLDMIGEHIYKKVHLGDADYRNALHGRLKRAKFSNADRVQKNNPCLLDYNYDTYVTSNVIDPCEHKSVERFSEVSGGECTDDKIGDSNGGACAPFRRLHVCDRNLEQIQSHTITATDNLLVDVCMAAQFEGKSISGYYPRYQTKYKDSGSTICTVLARSFADIGDIIRGKDLYEGYDQKDKEQKVKLEKNLQKIFTQIYNDVTKGGTNGKLKEHYEKDKQTGNYYQLREDWWDANRGTVWYAITCGAPDKAQYFRKTCSGGYPTNKQCRCVNRVDVPTNFDYVPQFLRWFEEWTEEFCRKKKKKLEDVIKKCRYDENNERKYCSRNGFDCKDTIRAQEKLVKAYDCHKCSVACDDFEPWIKNQKQEFLKQKNKYEKEIEKYKNGTRQETNGTINNLYVDEFYEKLKDVGYGGVEQFLKKLSKEQICQSELKVVKETADPVDFTKDKFEKTFSYKKYCDTCPWCGTEQEDGTLRYKEEVECRNQPTTPLDNTKSTDIQLSFTDKGNPKILEKFKNLCENGNKETQTWKCHYVGPDEDYCVLQKDQKNTPHRTIMPYVTFFNVWINEMLDDSIKWRNEHSMCINNKEATKCIGGCKKACECFRNWVEQKEKEWNQIEQHFDKQKNTGPLNHYTILQSYLSFFFKEKIKEAYGEEKCDVLMNSFNNIQEWKGINDTQHSNDPIKILLKHEDEIAEKCKETHTKEKCEEQEREDLARSAVTSPDTPRRHDLPRNDFPNEKEFEDEEEEEEEEEEEVDVEAAKTEDAVVPPATPGVNPCQIVKTLFEKPKSLDEACGLKYSAKTRNLGWKCVTPSGDSTTTSDGSDSTTRKRRSADSVKTSDSNQGSICIPPRRRKLYIHDIQSLGVEVGTTPTQEDLLKWFVKSAAVETFFLWDRYKKENKPQSESLLGVGSPQPLSPPGAVSDDSDPENQLQSGNIPTDFLRLMFYTLADYKDILFSGGTSDSGSEKEGDSSSNNNIVVLASGKENKEAMKKIQEQLKKFFQNSGNQSSTGGKNPSQSRGNPSNSGNDPETLWQTFGPSIWEGMICALTYKENGSGGEKGKTSITQIENADNLLKKLKEKYGVYESVELEDSNESRKMTGDTQPPTLKQFTSRPPYFRYLEEWGQNFCKERKKRLDKIKYECLGEDEGGARKTNCSGDGFECKKEPPKTDGTITTFDCPDCARHCGLYKRWIGRKKDEFEKQQNAYAEQREKAQKNNNNGFCGTLEKDAAAFLERLKNGPCSKKDSESGEDKTGNSHIKFNEGETFEHTNLCDPCPILGVQNTNTVWSDVTKKTCKDNAVITKDNIKTKIKADQQVVLHVSDNSDHKFETGLDECKEADIFKGIRKEEWECDKLCNSVVCFLKKKNENGTDLKQYIEIRALLKRWVDNFFDDYNKIKHKISHCTKSENKSKCIRGCNHKCNCVKQWIAKKREEWEKIRKRYLQQYENTDSADSFTVKTFLEELIPQIAVTDVQNKIIKLSKFDNPCGCSFSANSTNGNEDAIDCMLNKLQQKAKTCHDQASGYTQTACENSTPLEDDDEEDLLLEVENEKTNKQPSFCPEIKSEQEEKGGCEEAPTAEEPAAAPGEETINEQTPVLKPEEEAPVPEQNDKKELPKEGKKEKQPPTTPQVDENPFEHPAVIPSLVTSTLAWSVGIVVLEPSGNNTTASGKNTPSDTQNDIQNDDIPSSKITDNEWNTLKHDFISNMLQNEPNTEPNMLHDNVDNNTHPTPSHNKLDQKPFIMSIHDRNLYIGEEYSYDMSTNSGQNNVYSGIDPTSDNRGSYSDKNVPINDNHHPYSGIDLINDALNGDYDIYDEMLKRKENELFGTNHVKHTSTHSVAKNTNSDPILNQINLFHKWLDRHRNMCEKLKNKEDILNKLKEEWNKENNNNSAKTYNSDNKPK